MAKKEIVLEEASAVNESAESRGAKTEKRKRLPSDKATIKEEADLAIKSGLTPIRIDYEVLRFFDTPELIVSSHLVIESLDLGTLGYKEYRFIARRTKKGDRLVERHIEKVFRDFRYIEERAEQLYCVVIPIFPRLLRSGGIAEMLVHAFARFPEVSPEKVCIAISADILYEDIKKARDSIEELRALGVKVAVFEVGDEFCPVFRLSEFSFDFAIAEKYTTDSLSEEGNERTAESLVKFLHLLDARVLAPGLKDEESIERARYAGFDGYGMGDPLPDPKKKEENKEPFVPTPALYSRIYSSVISAYKAGGGISDES